MVWPNHKKHYQLNSQTPVLVSMRCLHLLQNYCISTNMWPSPGSLLSLTQEYNNKNPYQVETRISLLVFIRALHNLKNYWDSAKTCDHFQEVVWSNPENPYQADIRISLLVSIRCLHLLQNYCSPVKTWPLPGTAAVLTLAANGRATKESNTRQSSLNLWPNVHSINVSWLELNMTR